MYSDVATGGFCWRPKHLFKYSGAAARPDVQVLEECRNNLVNSPVFTYAADQLTIAG